MIHFLFYWFYFECFFPLLLQVHISPCLYMRNCYNFIYLWILHLEKLYLTKSVLQWIVLDILVMQPCHKQIFWLVSFISNSVPLSYLWYKYSQWSLMRVCHLFFPSHCQKLIFPFLVGALTWVLFIMLRKFFLLFLTKFSSKEIIPDLVQHCTVFFHLGCDLVIYVNILYIMLISLYSPGHIYCVEINIFNMIFRNVIDVFALRTFVSRINVS